MAKAPTRANARKITCPITGKTMDYQGVGRPPKFHSSANAKQRREYNAKK